MKGQRTSIRFPLALALLVGLCWARAETVLDRYPSRGDYLGRIVEAAIGLERDGYLLPEDALELIRSAAQRDLWSQTREEAP
jgi:hypothetical protein